MDSTTQKAIEGALAGYFFWDGKIFRARAEIMPDQLLGAAGEAAKKVQTEFDIVIFDPLSGEDAEFRVKIPKK